MAQRLFSAVVCAIGQSPARLSHRSGSPVSAPCSSINRARLTRPRRSQRWQLTSSIVSLPSSSPRVIDPRLIMQPLDSTLSRQIAIFRSMPLPELTEEERAEVIQAIRAAIDGDRYVLSPRVRRLKGALAKLDPPSAERTVTPFPPPKPSGTPSLVYQRLKGGRRRR